LTKEVAHIVKKSLIFFLGIAVLALTVCPVTAVAADQGPVMTPPIIGVSGISLDRSAVTVAVGIGSELIATRRLTSDTDWMPEAINWTSNNTGIVAVKPGAVSKTSLGDYQYSLAYECTIQGVAPGTASVTATAGGLQAVCTVTVTETGSSVFTDMNGHWADDQVQALVYRGVINGYPDDTFRPDQPITRAEFTAMLVGLLKTGMTAPAKSDFQDVSAGDWFYDAVESAFQAGWVKGFDDGTFKPDAILSREQAVSMVANVLAVFKIPVVAESLEQFTDVKGSAGAWWYPDLVTVYSAGLIRGMTGTTLAPAAGATRAQAAVIAYGLLQKLGKS
jgi:hypothetical protein